MTPAAGCLLRLRIGVGAAVRALSRRHEAHLPRPWGVAQRSRRCLPPLRYKTTEAAPAPPAAPKDPAIPRDPAPAAKDAPGDGPAEARLLIGFTCRVCNHRQHKTMSKNAYENGVVLIQCDQCKNRHLIADNLGWFRDGSVNVEDLLRERGEEVRRLQDLDLLDGVEASWVRAALADCAQRKPPSSQ
ncbi:hypothetical protein H4R18_003193 [Coemansia javaensis]|uniref:DNL-type domain-containing protein n=1 Tax=Coemansia javaensis TaxID=2761396 RepID=A0A9W8H9K7_9FUNG|nr:hypothetical protein H4R18_003193 [Coemansia javaensis]